MADSNPQLFDDPHDATGIALRALRRDLFSPKAGMCAHPQSFEDTPT